MPNVIFDINLISYYLPSLHTNVLTVVQVVVLQDWLRLTNKQNVHFPVMLGSCFGSQPLTRYSLSPDYFPVAPLKITLW